MNVELERRAYLAGGGDYVAPAQRLCDMVEDRESQEVSPTSYHLGLAPTHLRSVLRELYDPIAQALVEISEKMPGFLGPLANAIGVESRTSSPVQVARDADTLQCLGLPGVYACGEGAGYAGGIVSAALDGMRVAAALGQLSGRNSLLGQPFAAATTVN